MNHHLENRNIAHHLSGLIIAASVFFPFPAWAGFVALSNEPMTTSTSSNVKPNIMFVLDDSGSMDESYLPDWAGIAHPVTGIKYNTLPELFRNNGFNGVAYNPAITYTPPVLFNTDGSLNTTTYPSIPAPWTAVKNDGLGAQILAGITGESYWSSTTSNLVGNAFYYVFVPGEHCSSTRMNSCVTSAAPTTIGTVTYDKPAGLRWCNSAALTTCQSIYTSSTFNYPRYPGLVVPPTATLKVTAAGTASHIIVNGQEILSGTTNSSRNRDTVASRIVTNINNCTAATTGNCTIAGYSATSSGSTVTIVAPAALGAITYLPTASGTMSQDITAFTGSFTVPGSNVRTNIVSTTASYPKGLKRTDCLGATCTYAEEMTNFANWWTYYHTRMQAMKTAVSRSFKTLSSGYRVGFSTISYTGASNGTKFLGNDTFELSHKNSWFKKLLATTPSNATPLRGALSKAGRYYAKKITGQTDPVQYSCQQNFTILSTDGYWNTYDEIDNSYRNTDLAGGLIGNLDSDPTTRPVYEGPAASSGSLADVSKYYYDTDLRTSTLGNCSGAASTDYPTGNSDVCTDNVLKSTGDSNTQQHMTTYTMGLGADGTLNFTTDYDTATSGDFHDLKTGTGSPTVNWPDPITYDEGERIDDLWHAAVSGHGTYFSAKDPDQIVTGFTGALEGIRSKHGAAAAAATSTLNPIAGDNFAYVASYTTMKWTGNLEARTINVNDGVVSNVAYWCAENVKADSCVTPGVVVIDTNGSATVHNCVVSDATLETCPSPGVFDNDTSKCITPIANTCVGKLPPRVMATSDTRKIYTVNSSGSALTDFVYANVNHSYFDAAHISGLSQWPTIDHTAAAGENLVNYLRGQFGYETRSSNSVKLYRTRESVLGDALESQPSFIGAPVFNYTYSGYQAYKSANSTRPGTVYLGANDGMLHAFNADTGEERWAFVPSMVIPNMWKLASADYASHHVNLVNGSPVIADIYCTADCGGSGGAASWRTILVAGLNAGGRGYYALDITNPTSPSLLWEFTPSDDSDLGYTFGRPVITTRASDGTWVVLVTSGYDNGTLSSNALVNNSPAGNGVGYLYVLDASTGVMKAKIATTGIASNPNGLAQISAWNDAPSGNQAGEVYGGDLQGNVWRFDIDAGTATNFAQLSAGGFAQPITTRPVLGKVGDNHVVFLGTGKYLEASDLSDKHVQSYYAIKDDGSAVGNPRAHTGPADKMVQQTITATGGTREESTTKPVDFDTDRGWYLDFPDVDTGSERVNIDGSLVLGTLIVPTIVPSSAICSPGGRSWLNFFSYENGGPTTDSSAAGSVNKKVSIRFDDTIVGTNVIFIKGKPVVEVVTSDDPTPQLPNGGGMFFKSYPSDFANTQSTWREISP